MEENSKNIGPFSIMLPKVCGWEEGTCVTFGAEGTGSRFGFGIEALSEEAGPMKLAGTWVVTAK